MRWMRRGVLAFGLAAAVVTSGCVEYLEWLGFSDLEIAIILGLPLGPSAKAPTEKINETVEIRMEGSMGGLSGDYEITFSRTGGPEYGTLSGTTSVKRGRFVSIKDKGSESLKSVLANIAQDRLGGGTVTITKASGKFKGSQTPGGVDSVLSGKLKFKGTVSGGPSDGATIKNCKLTIKDTISNTP